MAVNAINSSGCDETPPSPPTACRFSASQNAQSDTGRPGRLALHLGQGADTAAAAANAMPYLFWHVKAHPAVLGMVFE